MKNFSNVVDITNLAVSSMQLEFTSNIYGILANLDLLLKVL